MRGLQWLNTARVCDFTAQNISGAWVFQLPNTGWVFCLLAFYHVDDVVGGTGCGKKYNALYIFVRLFPRSVGNDVESRRDSGAQNKRRLGLTFKNVESSFAVE